MKRTMMYSKPQTGLQRCKETWPKPKCYKCCELGYISKNWSKQNTIHTLPSSMSLVCVESFYVDQNFNCWILI